MAISPAAKQLALRLIEITNEFPGLSFFEIQQALGSASVTLTHQSVANAGVTDEEKTAIQAEADVISERILTHLDAVRQEKQTAPAVDFMVAANVLAHAGVHFEAYKTQVLAAKAAEAATEK